MQHVVLVCMNRCQVEEKASRKNEMVVSEREKMASNDTPFFHLASNVSNKLKPRRPDPYMAVFSLIGLDGSAGKQGARRQVSSY